MSLRSVAASLRSVAILALVSLTAFGQSPRPPLKKTGLLAPVHIDGVARESIWVFPNADEKDFWVEAKGLLRALAPVVTEETLQKLSALPAPQGVLSATTLLEYGIRPIFRESRLDFFLEIAPEARARDTVYLSSQDLMPEDVYRSAMFSGFVNARVAQAFAHPDFTGVSRRLPFEAGLEYGSNLNGLIARTGADYGEGANYPWRRQDTYLAWDDTQHLLRYTAGDVQPGSVSYQSSVPMGGFSLSRDFSLQPLQLVRPVRSYELVLKRPSLIEIFINGYSLYRFERPAGPVDLRDIPLSAGVNDVQILVRDDLGAEERISLSLLFDSQVLPKGRQEFSYNLGFPWRPFHSDRFYDEENPSASFFHRFGLTDVFTGGVNLQADSNRRMLGFESLWAHSTGLWSMEPAISQDSEFGGAVRLRYRSMASRDLFRLGLNPSFSVGGQYMSSRFAPIGSANTAFNPYDWRLESGLALGLPAGYRASLTASYDFARLAGMPDQKIAFFETGRVFSSQFDMGLHYRWSNQSAQAHQFRIYFNWRETARTRASVAFDHPGRHVQAEVRHERASLGGILAAEARMRTNSPGQELAQIGASHIAPRAEFYMLHETYFGHSLPRVSETNFSMASAFVWAGPHFAVSRRVNEAFALFPVSPELEGLPLEINEPGRRISQSQGFWGPAVYPQLRGYQPEPILVDDTKLPPGYVLEHKRRIAMARFRSGVIVPLEAEGSVTLLAYLRSPSGESLPLLAGEFSPVDGSEPARSFFTNRKGRLVMEGLKPGQRYRVEFWEKWQPLEIETPADKRGLLEIEPLTLEP